MRWGGRRAGAHEFFSRFGPRRRRVNPLLALWRWRWEGLTFLGVPYGLDVLADVTHPAVSAVVGVSVAGTALGWRPARLFLTEHVRGVVVQHRLRVGMVQAGIWSWSGWLPAILWTAPVDRGIRVVLWLPAGVDVVAFEANREQLAAATWAADVEVARHPTRANVVVLLVVTRPDLAHGPGAG
jgi:hypothetical protein